MRDPGRPTRRPRALPKAPTGIAGLDDITEGGLPRGRPTLVCGGAGSGKTLLGVEFLARGAREQGEPGVLMAFEETAGELIQNSASFGFDLGDLVERGKLVIDYVHVDRTEIREMGEYSLEGLFVRLGHAIDAVGAKRVMLDSLETLFSGLTDTSILRAELRRLFRWLKDRRVTAIVTGELGDGKLTRHGLEEYVSDCVIFLDHKVVDRFATRRMRVVKYRGSRHGTDEYSFLIGERGLSVRPITSLGLTHEASTERVPTGVPRLDAMLGGSGYYRGGSVLVSGTPGTGKTSLSAQLMDATCRRGERCLAFLFEESPDQHIRNMRSIGIDLAPWLKKGLLRLHATRPSKLGLEAHLVAMHQLTEEFNPTVVILDPATNLESAGTEVEARSLLTRLIDFFKERKITTLFTSLTKHGDESEAIGISSLMDTWLLVRTVETNGERNRVLQILKSRGMAHSNQVREFLLTDHGIELVDVYVGPGGVLTGSARLAQEAREEADELGRREQFARRKRELLLKKEAFQAQVSTLRLELESTEQDRRTLEEQEKLRDSSQVHDRSAMARARQADQKSTRKARRPAHAPS
jgi:circadian clock protein KaiC